MPVHIFCKGAAFLAAAATFILAVPLQAQVPPPNGPGYALNLDGVDDYGLIPDAPALRFGNQFTIEFWFKPASLAQGANYLLARSSPDTSKQAAVIFGYSAPNQVEFFGLGYSGANPRPGSALTLPDTNWHHIAYSYDGSTWSGYLDGAQVFSVPRTFILSTGANNWTVGAPFTNAGPDNVAGAFDEIRLWNVRRSAAQIQEAMRRQLFSTESGLAGYWRCDEGSGPSAFDATGNAAQTAVLVNGPLWSASLITPFAPSVGTRPASNGPPGSVTLNGIAFFNGAATAAYFEWGATPSYGNVTPTQNFGSLGSNTFSQLVTGLTSGVLYHYRAVATNIHGNSFSADQTISDQASYVLVAAVIAGGGGETSGGSYNLSATIGQWDADPMAVTDELRGGFWNTEALPRLRIQRTGDSVLVAWLASFTGFRLQQSPAIAGAQVSWGNITEPVALVNGESQVTFNNLSGTRFFRLQKP